MGEKNFRSFKRTTGTDEAVAREAEKRANANGSTGNRSAENTRTDTERNDTGRTGNDTGRRTTTATAETVKNEEISQLPDVKLPTPTKAEEKKKRQPRKKKSDDNFSASQISALIVASSTIIASKQGFEHWLITEAEANQISIPLANIIEKNENLKALTEHTDSIALITACLLILAPRLMISFQNHKQNKEKEKVIKIDNAKRNNNTRANNGSNTKTVAKTTTNNYDASQSVLAEIPSIL